MMLFDPAKPPKSVSSPQTPRITALSTPVEIVRPVEPEGLGNALGRGRARRGQQIRRSQGSPKSGGRTRVAISALAANFGIEGDAGEGGVESGARNASLFGQRPQLINEFAKGRLMRRSGFVPGGACGKRDAEQSKRDDEGPQQGKTRAPKRACSAFLIDTGHIRGPPAKKSDLETAPK